MALDNIERRVVYEGDGSQKDFPFSFVVFKDSDITVSRSIDENRDETVATTEYSVELSDDGTGTVHFVEAPAEGIRIAILSAVPETQPMKLTTYDGFDPEVLNDSADRIVALIQQLLEKVQRAVILSPTDSMSANTLRDRLFQAAKEALESAQSAEEALAACEQIRQLIEQYSWDIPHIVDSLRDVERYPYDGLFWVGGFGKVPPGQDISNRYVKANGSTTQRTLGERFADVVSVKDFGAVGDGQHDDTEAIQAAIDSIDSAKILLIPSGTYKITSEISIENKNGLRIIGSGFGIWDLPSHGKTFTLEGTTILFCGTADKTHSFQGITSAYSVTDPDDNSLVYKLLDLSSVFSSAIFINGSQNIYISGLRVQLSYHGVSGYNSADLTGLGDDCDTGITIFNSSFVTVDDCQVVGYWRKAGLLLVNYAGDELGQGVFNRIQHCFLQGFRGLAIRSDDTFDSDATNVGVAGSSVRDCCITDLSHTSRLTATLLGFTDASAALEVSGDVMRDMDFDNVHFFGADCIAILHDCQDISFSACFAEPPGRKNTVGGGFLARGARFIATEETRNLLFDHRTEFNYTVDFSPYARITDANRYSAEGLFAPASLLFLATYGSGSSPIEYASPKSPATLHLTGNPGYKGLRICDDMYNPIVGITEDRRVGVNILRPSFPLHVVATGESASANNDIVTYAVGQSGIQFRATGTDKVWARLFNAGTTFTFSLSTGQNSQFSQCFYMNPSAAGCSGNFLPYTTSSQSLGSAALLWSQLFAATGTINTSDARLKTSLQAPTDALMRAWGKVNYQIFQFNDAVEKKGADARLHVGVIAQQVIEAFNSEGLDATRYGLLCYDEWDDQYEDVEVVDQPEELNEDGEVLTPAVTHIEHRKVLDAGNRYGIRYEEALALEAAYQRWQLNQLKKLVVGAA